MRVLIVGAGSVGQVYGHALMQGGAELTFYVRPQHRKGLAGGLTLYPLNRKNGLERPVHVSGYSVISEDREVRAGRWDYVILCTPATSLYTPWFPDFVSAIGSAVLVTLQPGLESREEILKHYPSERLLTGMITLISYATPLPGEHPPEPGTAYWLPPLTKVPFQGPKELLSPLIEVFRRGRFPCQQSSGEGNPKGGIVADTILFVFVLALEGVGWKIKSFLVPAQAAIARAAMLEVFEIQCRQHAVSLPWIRFLLGRSFFRLVVAVSQYLMPFDLETYLRVHFTKVRAQVRMGLANELEQAHRLGIATPALTRIAHQIEGGLRSSERSTEV